MLYQRQRRRSVRVGAAALVVAWFALHTAPVGADTGFGTAVGYTTNTDDGNGVLGSGTFFLAGSAGGNVNVGYECSSAATTPGSTGAGIQPPAHRGCYLERNGSIVSTATGLHVPGSPAAATGNVAAIPFFGTTSLRVCWNTYATFVTGYIVYTSGCTTISIIDSIPAAPEPGDNVTDDGNPIYDPGFVYAIGTGGQDNAGRVVCASTTGDTTGCVVGITSSGTSRNNDVAVSGSGPADGGCHWVCANPGARSPAAISATGTAGTNNCPNTLVAVSVTGNTCGATLSVSGTGTASGMYELSGKETLCNTARLMC